MSTRWSTTTKRVIALVSLGVAALVLMRVHEVWTPFVWAMVFAYVFGPIVAGLQRRTGWRRGIVVGLFFLTLAFLLYALARLLLPIVIAQLIDVQRSLPVLMNNVEQQLLAGVVGTGYESVVIDIFDQAGDVARVVSANFIPVAIGIIEGILGVLVFVIALFYFLRDGPKLGAALRQLFPSGQRDELLRVVGRIHAVLGQYVRGQVILIGIMWTTTTIGLAILQVPFSMLLGFLTGVLETIPIVGPITAGAIAVLVALGHPAPFGWSQFAYAGVVAAMYTVLRHVEDYLVIPQVIGRIVELHPLLIIFALLTGGALGGLLGILLAVPVAASLRIAFLYAVAKFRDEDPYRLIADTVPLTDESVGVTSRPA